MAFATDEKMFVAVEFFLYASVSLLTFKWVGKKKHHHFSKDQLQNIQI